MATLYVFEGIDERKQLAKAEKFALAGLDVEVHYHHAWEDTGEMEKIPCNEKCRLTFRLDDG